MHRTTTILRIGVFTLLLLPGIRTLAAPIRILVSTRIASRHFRRG